MGVGLVVLVVAIAAIAGSVVGRRVAVPYPTFLVVVGAAPGVVPVVSLVV